MMHPLSSLGCPLFEPFNDPEACSGDEQFPSHTGQASHLVAQSLGATGAH